MEMLAEGKENLDGLLSGVSVLCHVLVAMRWGFGNESKPQKSQNTTDQLR